MFSERCELRKGLAVLDARERQLQRTTSAVWRAWGRNQIKRIRWVPQVTLAVLYLSAAGSVDISGQAKRPLCPTTVHRHRGRESSDRECPKLGSDEVTYEICEAATRRK